MAILATLEDVGHEWPGKRVFSHQSTGIYEGDRIGIVGRNGDGKSTLLELIAKRVDPDEGTITWRSGISVGVLAQNDSLADDATVLASIVEDTPEYEWAGDPRTRSIMGALLEDIELDALVGTLSGGQRRRVDLARLLIGRWDVLCLDEPTNHLDVVAIDWLADHLKNRWPARQGALLVVTHDRWFLDEVATSMWEIHDGVIDPFEGGFSAYIQQRLERDRVAAVREERRQSMLRKELAWLSRGAQARTSKAKFRIEAAQALIADVPPLRNPIELKRMAVSRLGKQVIEMEDVSMRYDEEDVVSHVDWIIGPGDRIGILGKNGAGKTTLLELMSAKLEPTRGRVRIGKSVRFGILSQRLETFEERGDWTVHNILAHAKSHVMIDGKDTSSEKLLERLGFSRAEFMSRVDELSGGQKRRLALLLVLLDEPNVLLLDEPGNDLDTDMLAAVEDLLDSWPGTLVVVTHDRHLIERVTDDLFALIDGRIQHLPRGVGEYLQIMAAKRGAAAPTLKAVASGSSAGATQDPAPVVNDARAMGNAERRELRKRFDSLTRRLPKAQEAPKLAKAALDACDPTDFEELMRRQAELDRALEELDAMEMEWLELSELFE